jgi:hypothetical protein
MRRPVQSLKIAHKTVIQPKRLAVQPDSRKTQIPYLGIQRCTTSGLPGENADRGAVVLEHSYIGAAAGRLETIAVNFF